MESTESHSAGFPSFPHSLEIPSGLPHFHGLDDEYRYTRTTPETSAKASNQDPWHREGVVTDVPGPKCNGCSGTLTPLSCFCCCSCLSGNQGRRCGQEQAR